MEHSKTKVKRLALAMIAGLLLPLSIAAQQDDSRGLFGRGIGSNYEIGASGLLNQGFGATSGTFTNQGFGFSQGDLDNQGFGGTQGGITNQTFDVPLSSGLLFMLAAGAGYATLKKRKSNR